MFNLTKLNSDTTKLYLSIIAPVILKPFVLCIINTDIASSVHDISRIRAPRARDKFFFCKFFIVQISACDLNPPYAYFPLFPILDSLRRISKINNIYINVISCCTNWESMINILFLHIKTVYPSHLNTRFSWTVQVHKS